MKWKINFLHSPLRLDLWTDYRAEESSGVNSSSAGAAGHWAGSGQDLIRLNSSEFKNSTFVVSVTLKARTVYAYIFEMGTV